MMAGISGGRINVVRVSSVPNLRDANVELGPLEDERLLLVVTDQFSFAVLRTAFRFCGASSVTSLCGSIRRQRLVAGLSRLVPAGALCSGTRF